MSAAVFLFLKCSVICSILLVNFLDLSVISFLPIKSHPHIYARVFAQNVCRGSEKILWYWNSPRDQGNIKTVSCLSYINAFAFDLVEFLFCVQVPPESANQFGELVADPVTNELLHYTEKPETFVCTEFLPVHYSGGGFLYSGFTALLILFFFS